MTRPENTSATAASNAFEIDVPIEPGDIDALGHVNNAVHLRWVQEAATAHWSAFAPPDARATLTWVVHRHEIDYLGPVLPDDRVTVRTWVGATDGILFERFTEIARRDGRILARARTLWCPVDVATGKPRRVGSDVARLFSTGRSGRDADLRNAAGGAASSSPA